MGVSVVNALSARLELEIRRDGVVWRQTYRRGEPESGFEEIGTTDKTGTRVTFQADPEIFPITEYDFDILSQRLRELSFLNAGLRIQISDERSGKEHDFCYEGGIVSFVEHLNRKRAPLHRPPIFVSGERKMGTGDKEVSVTIEIAIQYNESYNEAVYSFANNINTVEGGSHLVGFRTALTRTLNRYITNQAKNGKGDGGDALSGDDTREGLTAVISVKLPQPEFEGQTKTKLGTSDVRGLVEGLLYEQLGDYLEENPGVAKPLIAKVQDAARAPGPPRARPATWRGARGRSPTTACRASWPTARSASPRRPSSSSWRATRPAGGTAKQGRSRETQAILPIRGKILNVERARLDKMLSSQEIQALVTAIGCGIGPDFDVEKARYHKIIIMTDADVDGSHIRTLLLTFFYRQMRALIERGYLYIAQPPLFKVKKGRSERYIKDERALEDHLLDLALDGASVTARGGDELSGEELRELLSAASQYKRILGRVALRRLDERVVDQAIREGEPSEDTLRDEAALRDRVMPALAARLAERTEEGPEPTWQVEADPEHGAHRIVAETRRAGVVYRTYLDIPFLRSPDAQRLAELWGDHARRRAASLPGAPRRRRARGDRRRPRCGCWTACSSWVRRGLSIQRYKGLGEMNPDQLADTTMNPTSRTLLQVRASDEVEADDAFTTLMGDDVEPRRQFIERNALDVQNLDI